ncbi:MAG: hypothetical protein F4X32_01685 [Candidatus Dadabacteria bacterium]|nr:hypothetical protein [Candidatus Dadabacteria bacterium]
MRKILILSFLIVLLAGEAKAEDDYWTQAVTINGKQNSVVYKNGGLIASTYQKLNEKIVIAYYLNYSCQNNDLSFSFVYSREDKQLLNSEGFGVKFDNNPHQYFGGYLPPGIPNWINFGRNHPAIEKAKIHKSMWVLFFIKEFTLGTGWQGYVPYKVKFDLTGFSRELAKCSKIPDTN